LGLITKNVLMKWSTSNKKHYKSKGYPFTKMGDEFEIKTKDLLNGSQIKVDINCDGCSKKLKNIPWQNYIKYVKNDGKYYCNKCAQNGYKKWISFKQWCIENNRQDVLDRWDYELNNISSSEITYATHKSYFFKCPRGIHKSELKNINSFTNGQEGVMYCKKCNSFAQFGLDYLGDDFLELYWDYNKNTVNPWEIPSQYNKKVYIICQEKDYHGSYYIDCYHFVNNKRCSYCHGLKVHPLDSLGKLLEDNNQLNLWSNKNKKSPYEYLPFSRKEVYWKCPEGKHEDYPRSISNSNNADFRCPECIQEKNESMLQEKIRLYLEGLKVYTILHENKCTIIPQNPKVKNKRGQMPYDNEIKELKIIIEVHGIQHYEICGFHYLQAKKSDAKPEQELHYQKLKDRYKRIFAKSQGYLYLEIPYWTDDKEETWKKLIDDKINEKIAK